MFTIESLGLSGNEISADFVSQLAKVIINAPSFKTLFLKNLPESHKLDWDAFLLPFFEMNKPISVVIDEHQQDSESLKKFIKRSDNQVNIIFEKSDHL
jgi:hypothetical protein